MKKVFILALTVIFIGCNKKRSDFDEAAARQKFAGKWMLDREVYEVWEPMNTLKESENYPAAAGDSVFFTDKTIVSYRDVQTGVDIDQVDYSVPDENVLIIDEERWVIKKLTEHEFVLAQEDIDRANNRKDIALVYLKR